MFPTLGLVRDVVLKAMQQTDKLEDRWMDEQKNKQIDKQKKKLIEEQTD
jgi:hypothetical protein